ncbi:MAG: GNAT family N-acetyltransferase [Acidobacteria bacterium]|nr:GNAT family N-acetyltransferase [Acidobacteriota bacterium]
MRSLYVPRGREPQWSGATWCERLPSLSCASATLRELQTADAPMLLAHLASEEVSRYISPPPSSIEGFERFIHWAHRERVAGEYACFAVVPDGIDHAVGLFQVRSIEVGFATAEWGFVMGSAYWGSGLFVDAADAVLEFSFEAIGIQRLEARAAVINARGNGALRKLGAVQEAVLRRSFKRGGQFFDQTLWSILADDWRAHRALSVPHVH